jgi:hypothetical protein
MRKILRSEIINAIANNKAPAEIMYANYIECDIHRDSSWTVYNWSEATSITNAKEELKQVITAD